MPPYAFPPVPALDDVAAARAAHLASMTALPELYVDMHVRRAAIHAIEAPERIGYLAFLDDALVAFFVEPDAGQDATAILQAACTTLGAQSVWAPTYDPVVSAACEACLAEPILVGYSFRTYVPATLPTPAPEP